MLCQRTSLNLVCVLLGKSSLVKISEPTPKTTGGEALFLVILSLRPGVELLAREVWSAMNSRRCLQLLVKTFAINSNTVILLLMPFHMFQMATHFADHIQGWQDAFFDTEKKPAPDMLVHAVQR